MMWWSRGGVRITVTGGEATGGEKVILGLEVEAVWLNLVVFTSFSVFDLV